MESITFLDPFRVCDTKINPVRYEFVQYTYTVGSVQDAETGFKQGPQLNGMKTLTLYSCTV